MHAAVNALKQRSTRRLVFTAHPDDETLWCGGLLLRYPGAWTVVCCSTPMRDPIRAQKFEEACNRLGAVCYISAKGENKAIPLSFDFLSSIDLSGFDVCITHNQVGEYGHWHHRQTNELARLNLHMPTLTFGYGQVPEPADLVVELSDAEWRSKLDALRAYDHEMWWGGKKRPTWDALLAEYGTAGQHFGFNLRRETFAAH